MPVKSPCTGICFFSKTKGWCEGCGRTLQEAFEWRKLSTFHRNGAAFMAKNPYHKA